MKTVLEGGSKSRLFVISAPAGTGKTTLVQMLKEEFDSVEESVSYTTRPARPNEIDGKDYYFIDPIVFEEKKERGDFLEYANVFGHYYGTSKESVVRLQQQGKHVLLVIDTQGAMRLKKTLDAVFIFICPPNVDELKRRLERRQSETEESMATRLSWAKHEIERLPDYDYCIVNEKLNIAYDVLRSILIAEEHRMR